MTNCRKARISRDIHEHEVVLSFTEPQAGDNDVVAVWAGSAFVRDPDGHVVALVVSDPTLSAPGIDGSTLPVLLTYEADTDMGYLYLTRPRQTRIARTVERPGGSLVVDLDADGRLIGVEIFGASRWFCPDVLANSSSPGMA